MPEQVVEGKTEVVAEPEIKDGKHPEVVSWQQYVGIKESLGKKLDTATAKLSSLEEQLKSSPKPDEFIKTKAELEAIKAEHSKVISELKSIKDQSISEKRAAIIAKGVPADKAKDLSEKELDAISGVLGAANLNPRPKPDLGSGGGAADATLKSRERMQRGFSALHPTG
jgi:hypothetical protein